ncbi:MAG: alpha/beta hydrolase [Actinobacteria bacterium]|nr:alpha/beta hydrolase [Actinomycetota bacterium]
MTTTIGGSGTRAALVGSATEVPLFIPSRGERLGAVVTVPSHAPRSALGVVLMAGRARDRAHRNGMWVRVADALAARGMYSLRLDYPGVGNSSGAPTVFDLEDPPGWAVEDACELLLKETTVRRIALVGTCFGGRVVLEAASRIPALQGVAVVAAPTHARTRTRRLRLRVKLSRALGRPGPEQGQAKAALQRREGGLPLEDRVSPGFARDLRRTLERAPVYFLYADRDFAWAELRFALDRLKLPADRYELDVVQGEMHTFRSLEVQRLTTERIVEWCSRFAEGHPEGRG